MVAAAFTSSRKAFYDLQIQLAAGRIARRYVVLAHGWMPRTTQKIDAFLWWQGGSPTVAGGSYGSKSSSSQKSGARQRLRLATNPLAFARNDNTQ
jgi:23S rRNA-/tRNA-specific pseudouridylate synthase